MHVNHLWDKDSTELSILKTPSDLVMVRVRDKKAEMALSFYDEEAFMNFITDALKCFWGTQ